MRQVDLQGRQRNLVVGDRVKIGSFAGILRGCRLAVPCREVPLLPPLREGLWLHGRFFLTSPPGAGALSAPSLSPVRT